MKPTSDKRRRLRFENLEARLCMAVSVGWDGPGQGSASLTYYVGSVPASLDRAEVRTALQTALSAWSAVARHRVHRDEPVPTCGIRSTSPSLRSTARAGRWLKPISPTTSTRPASRGMFNSTPRRSGRSATNWEVPPSTWFAWRSTRSATRWAWTIPALTVP